MGECLFLARSILLILTATVSGVAALNPSLPSLFIAGDSTAADGIPDAIGWGRPFPTFFDPQKLNIVNAAKGGRSSRTFVTEGLWDRLLADVKPRDYVIIQFGHNDAGEINGTRVARGSLPGLGDETQEIDNQLSSKHETVRTFGWYMRKMIHETRDKGATPIVFSLTVRDIWKDGNVERGSGAYGEWIRELAKTENVAFVDLTNLAADRYESMGEKAVGALFPKDHTNTNDAGAELNAELVIAGLKCMRENAIIRTLSFKGRAIEAAPFRTVALPRLTRPPYSQHDEFMRWLNLPDPAEPGIRSLFLVGDSTVRNGRGDGIDGPGQWGWGDPLTAWFDPTRINVVNRAVGGTGVQSFTEQGYWNLVVAMLKPGDVVIMQFGHNDNGPRPPLHGIGGATETRQRADGTGETEHTWGWYLRKYIADARAKGAIPVVCTLVPRNSWENGRVATQHDSHADWARAVASAENAPLLDLNERIAAVYEQMGELSVSPLFADGKVHTSREGAELNARIVVTALKDLPDNPLTKNLRSVPAKVW